MERNNKRDRKREAEGMKEGLRLREGEEMEVVKEFVTKK